MQALHITHATADPQDVGPEPPSADPFASMAGSATLEFTSVVQLLAERARVVTGAVGVTIAAKDNTNDVFVYCATSGLCAAAAGDSVDIAKPLSAECVSAKKVVTADSDPAKHEFARALVPVIHSGEVVGLFEIAADRPKFSQDEILAVSRLAQMMNTAIEHRDAADGGARRILDANVPPASDSGTPDEDEQSSVLWQAAATAEPPEAQSTAAAIAPITVRSCQSCGFPISENRTLCVDCEQNPHARPAPTPLLQIEEEESWISRHGFMLGSLLITTLVGLIIYWLR